MAEDDNKSFYSQKHKINVTLSSQERINNILDRITALYTAHPIDSAEKQKIFLDLMKQYIVSAIPYLSNGDGKLYMNQLLSFKIKRQSNVMHGNQKFNYVFDPVLEGNLNTMLLKLQQKLRPILTRIEQDDDSGDPYN